MSGENKLQLAVNRAIDDTRMAASRMRAAYGGNAHGPIDQKRGKAWCEYGFPESITFDMLYGLYARGGIAHGVVEKLVGHCWKSDPWVIEGEPSDNAKDKTAWESKIAPLFAADWFWRTFKEADKRRLIGRYSGLVLQFGDNLQYDQPVDEGAQLVGMLPAWQGSLSVVSRETNQNSHDFGKPTKWLFKEGDVGGREVHVHPQRIFILGDTSTDAIAFLEPAFNAFVSLEKIEGGSGETFLKNAARQLNVNFDKEVNLENIAKQYGVAIGDLQQEFNKAARDVNVGSDVLLITQGASVSPLTAATPDPTAPFDVNLSTVSAAVDMPSRVIVGNQSGERSSTEDNKYMAERCQSRRGDLGFEIKNLLSQIISVGSLPKPPGVGFSVMWDDLREPSKADKLARAKEMSEINKSYEGMGVEVFSLNEIREAAGYEPVKAPKPMGEVDVVPPVIGDVK